MHYYTEITLLPSDEISLDFIWQKVYQQIHLALVEIKDKDNLAPIGISFPSYQTGQPILGEKLRLFGKNKEQLNKLNINTWLSRLQDYVHIKAIRSTPADINQYVRFTRYQPMANIERLARRRSKRCSESYKQSIEYYANIKHKKVGLPYINMQSLSSDKRRQFRLYIKQELCETQIDQGYTTYGLSSASTCPWF